MNDNPRLEALGTAVLTDRSAFLDWLKAKGWKRKDRIGGVSDSWYDDHWRDYFYDRQNLFRDTTNIFTHDAANSTFGQTYTEEFFQMLDELQQEHQPLQYYYQDDFACIVGYGPKRYVMPSQWYTFTPFQDYSHLTGQEFKTLGGAVAGGALPAVQNGLTRSGVEEEIRNAESEKEKLEQMKEEIEACKSKGLQELKAQMEVLQEKMEEQKKELLKEWQKKREKLYLKQQELEKTLFLLETQIYGIRCYLGEVVNLHQILDGAPAPVDTPVILYQKIRYLDEELGKYMSLYDISGTDSTKQTFLELLKCREDIRELFVPNDRCITLLRVSRTGVQHAASELVANTLERYSVYHGKQLALLMRDGGRLFITWLDDEKVNLSDENAFYQPGRKEEREYHEQEAVRQTSKEDVASRYFLLSMLQGLADNGTVFHLPEKVNITDPRQKLFVFSMADGWITDHTYGTFREMLDRISEIPFKEGDMVMATIGITRDDKYQHNSYGRASRFEKFNNDRGIGERNRTHDASIPRGAILPVNKILYDITAEFAYEKLKGIPTGDRDAYGRAKIQATMIPLGFGTTEYTWDLESYNVFLTQKQMTTACEEKDLLAIWQGYRNGGYYYTNEDGREKEFYACDFEDGKFPEIWRKQYFGAKLLKKEPHYFLSAKKEENWETGKAARANMEAYPDELIPLTYLCETWIKYVITTGNIGDWCVGRATLSYAEALQYLNKILEYLRERDKDVPGMLRDAGLEDWMQEHTDWDATLTEWRIANQVRRMTPTQAKRFAKHVTK